jgi:UDP-N-acetylbacillosamine N-acetyltransferase
MSESGQAVVLGAGGHSRSIVALLKSLDRDVIAVVDLASSVAEGERIVGVPVFPFGALDDLLKQSEADLVLAIGDLALREKYYAELRSRVGLTALIHPTAFVDPGARLGKGTVVLGMVLVNANAEVGENVLLNSGSIVEHEARVGDNSHISVNASICGRAVIGRSCFVGAGAVVKDNVTVSDRITLGAGAVAVNNLTEQGVYVGLPARRIS